VFTVPLDAPDTLYYNCEYHPLMTGVINIVSAATTTTTTTQLQFADVFDVGKNRSISYIINNASNPTLTLVRGWSYLFNLNASYHPFWINTVQGPGNASGYTAASGWVNGLQVGTIVFTVPLNAPDSLYYNCEYHAAMTGAINIVSLTTMSSTSTTNSPQHSSTSSTTSTASTTSTPVQAITSLYFVSFSISANFSSVLPSSLALVSFNTSVSRYINLLLGLSDSDSRSVRINRIVPGSIII
jgi:hypothetical protein